jgi:tetratricopeptide (TPR) repeat protein
MKSTATSLTLALLGIVAVSGCHQTAQRGSSIVSSLPAPSGQIEDYETRLSIALLDEQNGETKAAKQAYEKLVKDNPTNASVYHRLGIIAAGSGDFDTANGNFRRADELAPENAELLADWGYSLYLQGEYIKAEELTSRGAELAPDDSRIAKNLNTIHQNSPLSPPVELQMVQLLPSDDQGVIVAEALNETVAGSELECQQAGYEENLHPFEDVTLPGPTSEAEAVAQSLPELPTAEKSATNEPTATETAPTIPEGAANDFASIEQLAELPALNEPIAIAAAEAAPAESASFDETSIAPEHVRKLLTRARLELAAGDVQMSHAFAEAAAEIAIPLEVFQQRPEKVLDEIEFVTGHNSVMSLENPALTTAEFAQVVPPAPAAYDEKITSNDPAASQSDETASNDPQGFRAIGRTSLSITPKLVDSDGERRLLPERRAYRRLSQVPVVKHTVGYSRDWMPLSYSWEAPQLKYNPLYFEDAQLERYGNEVCILQPFLSGARFYTAIATLPYQMMSEGNSVCHTVYDFGYARPGDCVPYALEVPEFSWTGSLSSGAWVYALIVILP